MKNRSLESCNIEFTLIEPINDLPSQTYRLHSVRPQEIAEITPASVTQGKTWQHNEEIFAATHAIDKDLSTLSATHTDDGAGWLKLEFDKTYFVHKVVIYHWFYTNWYDPNRWCVQSEANFRHCVDLHNNVDVSVYQGEVKQKSCGTLQLTYGLGQSDQIYTLLCNTKGDTVKLTKNSGAIGVHEIGVTSAGIFSNFKASCFLSNTNFNSHTTTATCYTQV